MIVRGPCSLVEGVRLRRNNVMARLFVFAALLVRRSARLHATFYGSIAVARLGLNCRPALRGVNSSRLAPCALTIAGSDVARDDPEIEANARASLGSNITVGSCAVALALSTVPHGSASAASTHTLSALNQ